MRCQLVRVKFDDSLLHGRKHPRSGSCLSLEKNVRKFDATYDKGEK